MTFIYSLIDPRTNEVRYIGKSTNPEKRYKDHCFYDRGNYKSSWVKNLKSENLLPRCEVLWLTSDDRGSELEKIFIKRGRELGWPLTNLTDGGEGTAGHKKTPKTLEKMRQANLGKKLSEETKRKIGLAGLGRKHSEESKRKMSIALTSRPGGFWTPESAKRLAEFNRGRKHTEEHKLKISLGGKGRKCSEEHNRGVANAKRLLTDEQVINIKLRYARKESTIKELSQEYNVKMATIWNTINNKHKYLKDPKFDIKFLITN